jgi:hypothetical protein
MKSIYSVHPAVKRGWNDGDQDTYLKSAEGYVEEMFAGGKAKLRPLYDKLLKLGLKIGKDAKACPCQTIVPLYRNHVFAQIKPTTQTRIDMGFALGDMKSTGRLIDTGGYAKKDRITHRIPISSMDDIDDEVKHWLKVAYDRDAK